MSTVSTGCLPRCGSATRPAFTWVRAVVRLAVPAARLVGGGEHTFEATFACLGARLEPGGRWRVYAPFGLSDVFNVAVRANPVLVHRHVYQAKTDRWRLQWPGLTVLPWPMQSDWD